MLTETVTFVDVAVQVIALFKKVILDGGFNLLKIVEPFSIHPFASLTEYVTV
ncbi:hypothetical protein D3C85_1676280 [compost metagenome]